MTLTVPRLFALVGLATSVLGGVFGVINGFALARGWSWVPDWFFDAHPGTMEIGFVLPVAMGLAEWGLRRGMPEERASRAGLVQVGLMFLAFVLALFFFLAELEEQVGLATLIAVVGVVIFWARMWPIARRTFDRAALATAARADGRAACGRDAHLRHGHRHEGRRRLR